MPQIFFCDAGTPAHRPEDVIPFLGKGQAHWRQGRSAYEAAHSWFRAQDIPAPIRDLLKTDPVFGDAILLRAYFERQTRFDEIARGPSQTDVLAILKTGSGPAILAVEAKVDEPFGPTVKQWHDGGVIKQRRLLGLLARLRIDHTAADELRYQLLHRTAATLVEAEKAGAAHAALVVQSFSPRSAGITDFQSYAAAIGIALAPGALSKPVRIGAIELRLGWAFCPLTQT
ncbi:DUF6946 family protein [Pseudorhodoplanes sp.]|uniref:DUF6946 family protein n=1 Tax=Pseudorhodoplanes sp. TaxID=1934341 RepID=UPI00391AF21A